VCSDSDQAIRELLPRYPAARDIEITGAGLEDAFVRLTGDPDDDGVPAAGPEVHSAR
jgi:ABC-2 type transport system ATP-binding protein